MAITAPTPAAAPRTTPVPMPPASDRRSATFAQLLTQAGPPTPAPAAPAPVKDAAAPPAETARDATATGTAASPATPEDRPVERKAAGRSTPRAAPTRPAPDASADAPAEAEARKRGAGDEPATGPSTATTLPGWRPLPVDDVPPSPLPSPPPSPVALTIAAALPPVDAAAPGDSTAIVVGAGRSGVTPALDPRHPPNASTRDHRDAPLAGAADATPRGGGSARSTVDRRPSEGGDRPPPASLDAPPPADTALAERPAAPPLQSADGAAAALLAAASIATPAPAAPAGTPAPPVQASVATPVTSPEFRSALGVQVSVLAADGVQQAELQLNPAEMGPISVRITVDGGAARVDFGADLAHTRDIIEAGWAELASALNDAGFTLSGGGVSQQTPGRQRDAETAPARNRRDGAPADAPAAPPSAPRTVASGRIDTFA